MQTFEPFNKAQHIFFSYIKLNHVFENCITILRRSFPKLAAFL